MLTDAAAFSAADLALHVDLEARLYKREEARTHSHRHIRPEHLAQDTVNHDFARCKRNVLIHNQCLVLEESSLMMSIRRLIPVNTPRIYKPIGRLMRLHVTDTSASQMGTQTKFFIRTSAVMSLQPIGIHALSGRMVRREIQLIKGI